MVLPINRVGQNRIHTPYMTVYLVNFLPKIPIGLARTEPYTCTLYDRISGDFPAKNTNRVGQNRIHAPYMTVYLVSSLPKLPVGLARTIYIHIR